MYIASCLPIIILTSNINNHIKYIENSRRKYYTYFWLQVQSYTTCTKNDCVTRFKITCGRYEYILHRVNIRDFRRFLNFSFEKWLCRIMDPYNDKPHSVSLLFIVLSNLNHFSWQPYWYTCMSCQLFGKAACKTYTADLLTLLLAILWVFLGDHSIENEILIMSRLLMSTI